MSGYKAGKDAAVMARYLGHYTREEVVETKLFFLGLGSGVSGSRPWVDQYERHGLEKLKSMGYTTQWAAEDTDFHIIW